MSLKRPFVLSIAGFDPSAGAGVLADIKTMEELEVHGLAILTANTIQTESKFFSIQWTPISEVISAIEILMNKYPIQVIKIGIVPNAPYLIDIIKTIKQIKKKVKIIWDPVLNSSSGFTFFKWDNSSELSKILNQIYLITPNQMEYSFFKKYGLLKNIDFKQVAILCKGGHLVENKGIDTMYFNNLEVQFQPESFSVTEKHGSGCVLSSAIAAYTAKGNSLEESCQLGKRYIEKFLSSNHDLLGYHHV